MNERKVIVLKDKETSSLLPMAGIWIDNEAGETSAQLVTKKDKGVIAVKAVLREI